ncbi:hypothetical protein RF11_04537 [Thelohanellus kitauei]|uniref:Uncharacterized protein n=1 Tax=Thelohanellus kitauei TaxID=669202 RepID=A0A0C2MKD9_THEKT|nr:hypothetical protein RF11_04537 [Thelohanellus kitauei]
MISFILLISLESYIAPVISQSIYTSKLEIVLEHLVVHRDIFTLFHKTDMILIQIIIANHDNQIQIVFPPIRQRDFNDSNKLNVEIQHSNHTLFDLDKLQIKFDLNILSLDIFSMKRLN